MPSDTAATPWSALLQAALLGREGTCASPPGTCGQLESGCSLRSRARMLTVEHSVQAPQGCSMLTGRMPCTRTRARARTCARTHRHTEHRQQQVRSHEDGARLPDSQIACAMVNYAGDAAVGADVHILHAAGLSDAGAARQHRASAATHPGLLALALADVEGHDAALVLDAQLVQQHSHLGAVRTPCIATLEIKRAGWLPQDAVHAGCPSPCHTAQDTLLDASKACHRLLQAQHVAGLASGGLQAAQGCRQRRVS